MVAASFIRRLFRLLWLLALRDREMAGHAAAALVHARRTAVDHGAARIEVDDQPRAVDLIVAAIELDPADQGDELALRVVDAELPARGFARTPNDHSAGSVDAVDLDSRAVRLAAAGISDRHPIGVHRQVRLADVDVAREDGAVGAVLHLDPLGRDVDRGVGVVALEGGDRLLLPLLRGRAGRGNDQRTSKDDAKSAHAYHLTAPWTIFKRAPPSSTTVRSPRLAWSCPAWKLPSRICPATGPALASWRCFRSTVTSRVASRYPSGPATFTGPSIATF